jgi:hypothetical protein
VRCQLGFAGRSNDPPSSSIGRTDLPSDGDAAIDFTPQPDLYWKQAIALGAGWVMRT